MKSEAERDLSAEAQALLEAARREPKVAEILRVYEAAAAQMPKPMNFADQPTRYATGGNL